MAASLASWVAPACAALGLLLLAAPARGDFDECAALAEVPDLVLDTIVGPSAFAFGDSTSKTCDAIVKKGVSACKAQVKIADKCFRKAYDTNYAVALKQCAQLEDPTARGECKAEFKEARDAGKSDSTAGKHEAFETCEGAFALALESACIVGAPG